MNDHDILVSDLKWAIYRSWLREKTTHVRTALPVEAVLGALETLDIGNYHAASIGSMDKQEARLVEAWSADNNDGWRIRVSISCPTQAGFPTAK
jgi:hypothetical protein